MHLIQRYIYKVYVPLRRDMIVIVVELCYWPFERHTHTALTFHPLTLNIHFTTFDKPVKYYTTPNIKHFTRKLTLNYLCNKYDIYYCWYESKMKM